MTQIKRTLSEDDVFCRYSMLCNPRSDGDGKALASQLKARLKDLLVPYGSHVKLVSCRYISDGDIKVKFSVESMSVDSLTDLLYANESTLDIDILEAGEDRG